MAGGSLILKQDSPYIEHFYSSLQPWKHYVPFKKDLSDLVEKIRWAKEHDKEAREIAENAKAFARQHLLPKDVICYHALLLKEWTKKQKHHAAVTSMMDKVTDESVPAHLDCTCHDRKASKVKKNKGPNKKDEL
jgi:hypothetical protein